MSNLLHYTIYFVVVFYCNVIFGDAEKKEIV